MSIRNKAGRLMAASLFVAGSLAPSLALANANDMIAGGCSSQSDCNAKIHAADAKARKLFTKHGINGSSMMSAETVKGTVTSSGKVIVNGETVATGAESFGRQNISGSTKEGGFFRRSTSVSFQSSSLEAWVHMPNGKFEFALLTSCGNLVVAKPKVVEKEKKVVKKEKVVEQQPAPVVNVTQVQAQAQEQKVVEKETVVEKQVPVPTPAPQPVPEAQPSEALPETGAPVAALGGLTALGTTGWYYVRGRRRLTDALKNQQTGPDKDL